MMQAAAEWATCRENLLAIEEEVANQRRARKQTATALEQRRSVQGDQSASTAQEKQGSINLPLRER